MSALIVSGAPPLTGSMVRLTPSLPCRGGGDFGAQTELDALLLQDALKRGGDLFVHARDDPVEEFDHGDLGAQAAPDAAKFQADVAGANHHQMAGHFVEFERAGGGDDLLLIHRYARERNALAAGGDDDVFRRVAGAVDVDRARAR